MKKRFTHSILLSSLLLSVCSCANMPANSLGKPTITTPTTNETTSAISTTSETPTTSGVVPSTSTPTPSTSTSENHQVTLDDFTTTEKV